MYFKICPKCGSNLDPGEKCSCAKPVRQVAECLACGKLHAKADGKIVLFGERAGVFCQSCKTQLCS